MQGLERASLFGGRIQKGGVRPEQFPPYIHVICLLISDWIEKPLGARAPENVTVVPDLRISTGASFRPPVFSLYPIVFHIQLQRYPKIADLHILEKGSRHSTGCQLCFPFFVDRG